MTLSRKNLDVSIEAIRTNLASNSYATVVGAKFAFIFPDGVIDLDSTASDGEIVSRCALLTGSTFEAKTAMEILNAVERYKGLLFHAEYGAMINSAGFSGTMGDVAVALLR